MTNNSHALSSNSQREMKDKTTFDVPIFGTLTLCALFIKYVDQGVVSTPVTTPPPPPSTTPPVQEGSLGSGSLALAVGHVTNKPEPRSEGGGAHIGHS